MKSLLQKHFVGSVSCIKLACQITALYLKCYTKKVTTHPSTCYFVSSLLLGCLIREGNF